MKEKEMKWPLPLRDYLVERGVDAAMSFGADPQSGLGGFPMAAFETTGAVLFADLPGYSKDALDLQPAECAYRTSQFFYWFEGVTGGHSGGIVDKFIGDAVMVVFLPERCSPTPLRCALDAAQKMRAHDPYAFEPRFGIAEGPLAIALVGTLTTPSVSAVGTTVNLAARCATRNPDRPDDASVAVRVASTDEALVRAVFNEDTWVVHAPRTFAPKNMSSVQVIDVEAKGGWFPQFDVLAVARRGTEEARRRGTVRRDPRLSL